MMKKLMLDCGPTEEQPTEAFAILGEYAGLYADNGGDPDGNTWLPSNQDTIPADLAQQVVKEGRGRMVDVLMSTDEGMMKYFEDMPLREEMDEDTVDLLKSMANERLAWAHYGAYGAGDSHWVFLKEN